MTIFIAVAIEICSWREQPYRIVLMSDLLLLLLPWGWRWQGNCCGCRPGRWYFSTIIIVTVIVGMMTVMTSICSTSANLHEQRLLLLLLLEKNLRTCFGDETSHEPNHHHRWCRHDDGYVDKLDEGSQWRNSSGNNTFWFRRARILFESKSFAMRKMAPTTTATTAATMLWLAAARPWIHNLHSSLLRNVRSRYRQINIEGYPRSCDTLMRGVSPAKDDVMRWRCCCRRYGRWRPDELVPRRRVRRWFSVVGLFVFSV